MRILIAQINPVIGDVSGNASLVFEMLKRARERKAEVVLFPELTLCGYFPDDLLLDDALILACQEQLQEIIPETRSMFVAIGLPRFNSEKREKSLKNSAAILIDGKLAGFQDKVLLPTYDVFDERRYFDPGGPSKVWEFRGKKIGVTICEDAWQHAEAVQETSYIRDPIEELKGKNPDLLLNLSGSPYSFNRKDQRLSVFQSVARSLSCPVIFCNQVGANDQLIFDGHSLCLDSGGELCAVAKGFKSDALFVDTDQLQAVPPKENGIKDLYLALTLGVRDYFQKQGFEKAILGLSGGVDSALVACIAKDALGPENVHAVMMPSRYSSKGSIEDSKALASAIQISLEEVSIEPFFQSALSLLEPHFKNLPPNEAEENLQPRIRGMILMALSNKLGGIVLTTGNKSEMAMGYTTLYGDMVGGLGVLHDVTKMRIFELAKYTGVIPDSILTKAPSAELRENQVDEDTLPPYHILDPILEAYLEERLSIELISEKLSQSVEFIQNIVRKIHMNEYKRRQAPISLRVTCKAFNKGRFVPIVQKWR